MSLKTIGLAVALVAAISLGGCGQTGMGRNQEAGTGIGAVGGALAGALIANSTGGNPLVGAAIGAVAGGIIGNAIGASLDEEERRQLALATQQAVEQAKVRNAPPKRVTWKRTNPSTNAVTASGWVIPKSDEYKKPDGQTCRDVTQTVEKNGQSQSQDITLCKTQVAQADGSTWVIPR